jgi:hypothetical protein
MGGACNANGGNEKCVQSLGGERKENDQWEDLGISDSIVIKWTLKHFDGLD